jgi:GAF domain-containing protein
MVNTVKLARDETTMNEDAGVHDPRSGRSMGARELQAAHEIAQAFLAATRPIEVYRLALARVTPMVNADFAAVFLRDERDHELLRPVCLHGWPQSSARYIGQMRIRVGLGPTGRAVADNSPVAVTDIFADDGLGDWHEPARELGIASMITLPLATQTAVNGAISFYYVEPHPFGDDERSLLRLISEQLAATTTRARVLDELRIENERLRRDGEHLAAAVREAEIDARRHDRLIAGVVDDVSRSLAPDRNGSVTRESELHEIAGLVDDLGELIDLRLGRARPDVSPVDALRLAKRAADAAGDPPPGVEFDVDAGDAIIAVATDADRVSRVLAFMLREAYRRTVRGSITLSVNIIRDETGQWAEWIVCARGMGVNDGAGAREQENAGSAGLHAALATAVARALGGSIVETADPDNGWSRRLRLPLRGERAENG